MAATGMSQWLFPVSAIVEATPSRTTSSISVEKELYDRARGVEFLFRLGVTLGLPSSAMYTAATWFHRFYMRCSMEDYHRQDVAAACIFLATKTEECGRKLRDVAKVYCSKLSRKDAKDIPDDAKEVEECQSVILLTEEVLLEALCFDFIVASPQSDLVDLFEAQQQSADVEQHAWSIANDSFRTPLCVLYPSRVIAAACYILAQHHLEGSQALSLADRISSPAPSTSLPTPPSHKPGFSDSARFALEFYNFNEMDLVSLAEALTILLEFYAAQDLGGTATHLAALAAIPPPSRLEARTQLYVPFMAMTQTAQATQDPQASDVSAPADQTEKRVDAQAENVSPSKLPAKGWIPVRGTANSPQNPPPRLDLS